MTIRPAGCMRTGLLPAALAIFLATAPSADAQEQAAGTLAVPPAADAPAMGAMAAGDQPGAYTIVQGDTLWDIANAHYRDPFLWPLIWKSNAFISDPDLIYPGNVLTIPGLAPVERAMAAPSEPPPVQEETAAPAPVPAPAPEVASVPAPIEQDSIPYFFRKQRVESMGPEPEAPEQKRTLIAPEDARPALLDNYAILSGGFVSDEPSRDTIIGSATDPGKSIFAYDDVIFIKVRSRQDVKVGDRFLIYQPVHRVRHPVSGRSFGRLYRVMGILKVTAVREDAPLTARITLSFSDSAPGSLLTPYQEPAPLYPQEEKQVKDLAGHVLEVTDRRTINAQMDIVYLDKGKIDGVIPGDRFVIYTEQTNDVDVPKTLGEAEVFLVKERTATAVIRKSTDVISRGDRYRYKN